MYGEEIDFSNLIKLYSKLHSKKFDNKPRTQERELSDEGLKRINQLQRVVKQISVLHKELKIAEIHFFPQLSQEIKHSDQKSAKSLTELIDEIEFLTEATYYIAFRLRKIIRSFPELTRFEVKGVTIVRNQILEHPEQPNAGVYLHSFGIMDIEGPILKAIRIGESRFGPEDSGLYVNLLELINNLEKQLISVLNKPN